MTSFEENARELTPFGLTHNQAKIYLANIELGVTSVEPISKISMVRREDVYRILPKLYEIGIMEKVLGNPTKVRAIPVEKAITLLVKSRQEDSFRELRELEHKADEFSKNFRPAVETIFKEDDDSQFTLISGKNAVRERAMAIFQETEKEIDAVISRDCLYKVLSNNVKILEGCLERKVVILIISDVSRDESHSLEQVERKASFQRGFAFRSLNRYQSDYIISDQKVALFNITGDTSGGNVSLLSTKNHNFVSLLRDHFENTWMQAHGG